MNIEEDYQFACPYCWQVVSVRLDLSVGGQEYIQDCEVCCNPVQISYDVVEGHVDNFSATDIGQ